MRHDKAQSAVEPYRLKLSYLPDRAAFRSSTTDVHLWKSDARMINLYMFRGIVQLTILSRFSTDLSLLSRSLHDKTLRQ